MKVKDVMMGTPVSCTPQANLGSAAETLWNRNCGMLPVVDAQQKVVGVVTDRDICIALGTRNRLAGEVCVGEVTSGKIFACKPDDEIRAALATMADAKVRRLLVVDADGKLQGVLSMDDVVIHSEAGIPGKTSDLSHDDVVETLKRLYRPELPQVAQRKTAGA